MSATRTAFAAALLALLPSAALAQSRERATVLMSEDPRVRKFQDDWGYADAVVSGDMLYLSGVVVFLGAGETDLDAAFTRGFERIGETLRRAGGGWGDVLEITSYHTDLTTQMPAIVAVKNRYVKAPPPAWTAVEVSRLIPDRGIAEIKLIARINPKN